MDEICDVLDRLDRSGDVRHMATAYKPGLGRQKRSEGFQGELGICVLSFVGRGCPPLNNYPQTLC
jgi:hypothetical protein